PPAAGTPQAEALAELLKEGRKALDSGRAEEAIGIYTTALMLDNRNLEARKGMQEASRLMRRQLSRPGERPERPEPPEAPEAPESPTAAHPAPAPRARPSSN